MVVDRLVAVEYRYGTSRRVCSRIFYILLCCAVLGCGQEKPVAKDGLARQLPHHQVFTFEGMVVSVPDGFSCNLGPRLGKDHPPMMIRPPESDANLLLSALPLKRIKLSAKELEGLLPEWFEFDRKDRMKPGGKMKDLDPMVKRELGIAREYFIEGTWEDGSRDRRGFLMFDSVGLTVTMRLPSRTSMQYQVVDRSFDNILASIRPSHSDHENPVNP